MSLNMPHGLNPIEGVLKEAQGYKGSLLLYGSSSKHLSAGRDIDAMIVTSKVAVPLCQPIPVHLGNRTSKCNLYLIPQKVFLEDLRTLAYGGYYIHKVALGFNVLSAKRTAPDPAYLYWSYEWKLRRSQFGNSDIELFLRSVHQEILKYRPTFLRSLANYTRDLCRQATLTNYVKSKIVGMDSRRDEQQCIVVRRRKSKDWESSLYRFWREYESHKGKGSKSWSPQTIVKLGASVTQADYLAVNTYFTGESASLTLFPLEKME